MLESHCEFQNVTNHILRGYDDITPKEYMSVGEFMYTHKTGRYYISAARHAIAYIDGVWYDNSNCFSHPDTYLTTRIICVFDCTEIKKRVD